MAEYFGSCADGRAAADYDDPLQMGRKRAALGCLCLELGADEDDVAVLLDLPPGKRLKSCAFEGYFGSKADGVELALDPEEKHRLAVDVPGQESA